MKKFFVFCCTCLLLFGLAACAAQSPSTPEEEIMNEVIRLSTTTSVNDSGLMSYLQPYFEADTGYKLEITSAGTGAAIEKGRTGDADCLLVHAKAAEEEFINEGFAEERVPFMFNFFVIVGPEDDPAGVRETTTAVEAFLAIANSGSTFISRGDDSGTHKAEQKIWATADFEPTGADWYISVGAGMGQTLTVADEEMAYTLSDKATYLAHQNTLSLLKEEADELKNTYSMIAITPQRWVDTNYPGALAFVEWMTTEKALDLIDAFGVEEFGEPLFFSSR
jgi:tungstate transport system substrate-binding protein